MGAKASSLNCGCKRNKKNKYGRRGSRSGCKSSSHMRYADSFCDPYGGSVVVMQRIGSFRNRRLGSTRTNRQASLNLASLSEEGKNQLILCCILGLFTIAFFFKVVFYQGCSHGGMWEHHSLKF